MQSEGTVHFQFSLPRRIPGKPLIFLDPARCRDPLKSAAQKLFEVVQVPLRWACNEAPGP
jgi:hypothetical protein